VSNQFEKGATEAGNLIDRAKRAANDGFDRVRQTAGGAAETAKDWLETSIEFVRKNPASSLLCAMGAGFLLGWVYKNR